MDWLLLVCRVPGDPSSGRVFVWRKLKQLGAVAVQDAIWVLPATPRTREQLQWLVAEIAELGGEAFLFTSQVLLPSQHESLQERFEAPVRESYRDILTALKRRQPDLAPLSNHYQPA